MAQDVRTNADDDDEIGPTGVYEFGKPLIDGDLGGLNAEFVINKDEGLAAFCFGKGIGGFGLTHREALDMASRIRGKITDTFGQISIIQDESQYPIRFDLIDTEAGPRVMVWMPKVTTTIIGSAAFWLIFCDLLDAEAKQVLEN